MSKAAALALLLAVAEARFGQEQVPVAAVSALGEAGFGEPGVAATIAGSIPGSLLAAASPCQKVSSHIQSCQVQRGTVTNQHVCLARDCRPDHRRAG